MSEKRLYLSNDKVIYGVAGGIAEFFGIDATLVRLLFVLTLFANGTGILLYIAGMIVIPERPGDGRKATYGNKESFEDIKKAAKSFAEAGGEFAQDMASTIRGRGSNDSNRALGLILIAAGGILLVRLLIPAFRWNIFFPVILIIVGVVLIFRGFGDRP